MEHFEQDSDIANALAEHGWCVCRDWLAVPELQALHREVKRSQALVNAGVGRGSELQLAHDIRRDKIDWLEGQTDAQQIFLQRMDQLQQNLNRHLYLGLRRFEAHFARYDQGDYYQTHVDALKGSRNRMVSTVLYLNPVWNENLGGELNLYDAQGKLLRSVLPEFGTLALFMSEDIPHEVEPTKTTRYSIAGWFRVDDCLI